MSELRNNVLSGDWVIIAHERAKRPADFKKPKEAKDPIPQYQKECPFCVGNEASSGEETFRMDGERSWQTRCIYNKFPALSPDGELSRQIGGIYNSISGFGFHEVIVEHPRHDLTIALMPDSDVESIIRTYKNRYEALEVKKGIDTIVVFKNQGPQAGASLMHPHSQVIATPIVPPQLRHRMENASRYFEIRGECMLCMMLEEELSQKKRMVSETDNFISFVPFAPAVPFLIWIAPKRHMSSFDAVNDGETKDLARHLKSVLGRLYRGLDNPNFNYTIRSAPVREKETEHLHWYLSIVPRITNPAGFELGSGIFINTAIPEECAEYLRAQ